MFGEQPNPGHQAAQAQDRDDAPGRQQLQCDQVFVTPVAEFGQLFTQHATRQRFVLPLRAGNHQHGGRRDLVSEASAPARGHAVTTREDVSL